MAFVFFIIVSVVAFFIWSSSRKKANEQRSAAFRSASVVSGGVMAFTAILALTQCFTTIPAGSVGVVDFFGTVQEGTLKSGINLVNPLAKVVKMSIQTLELKETMDTPSKEGLTTQIEVSLLYHLNPEQAANVYKSVGENYVSV